MTASPGSLARYSRLTRSSRLSLLSTRIARPCHASRPFNRSGLPAPRCCDAWNWFACGWRQVSPLPEATEPRPRLGGAWGVGQLYEVIASDVRAGDVRREMPGGERFRWVISGPADTHDLGHRIEKVVAADLQGCVVLQCCDSFRMCSAKGIVH